MEDGNQLCRWNVCTVKLWRRFNDPFWCGTELGKAVGCIAKYLWKFKHKSL